MSRLAGAAGVPVRTVRFYISSRLLPSPAGRGRGASYSEEHLDRLRLIRTLADRRIPLTRIRDTVSTLTAQEVKKLLEREKRRSAGEEAASQTSPREYVSALLDRARRGSAPTPALRMPLAVSDHFGNAETGSRWRRIELAEGLELHVRADREAEHGRLAERIVSMATAERKEKE